MRRRAQTLTAAVALLVMSLMGPALGTPPGTDPDRIDGHKITICHVTNSASNPYVIITIDIAAWHAEGEVGHSPDHHVNHKTGHTDAVWDPTNGCEGEVGEDPGPL